MSLDCQAARLWLAEQGTADDSHATSATQSSESPQSRDPAAHVAECASCTALLAVYTAFTETVKAACVHEPSAEAEARFCARVRTVAEHAEHAELDPPTVDAVREALEHQPSPSGAKDFLKAARAQRAGHGKRTYRWRAFMAAAAAAAAVIAIMLWSPGPDETLGETKTDMTGLRVASFSGNVLVDGVPLEDAQAFTPPEQVPISTGEASHLQLSEPSSALVTVSSRTRFEISAWDPSSARLLLHSGTLRAQVQPREAHQVFEIRTPNAQVSVIGTEFIVSFHGGETQVKGRSGKVRVERRDGSFLGFVTAGQKLRVVAEPLVRATRKSAPTLAALPVRRDADGKRPTVTRGRVSPEGEAVESVKAASVHPEAPRRSAPKVQPAKPALVHERRAPKPIAKVSKGTSEPKAARARRRGARKAPRLFRKAVTVRPHSADESGAAAPAPAPVVANAPTPVPAVAKKRAKSALPPLKQAQQWMSEGQEARAIALLLETKATDWRRDALLGDAYQLSRQYPAAARAYERALGHAPGRPPAALLADLASVLERHLGQAVGATRTWRRYLRNHPKGADAAQAHLSLGRSELDIGKRAPAERHFRTVLAEFPNARQASAALTYLGSHLLRTKQWSAAERLFAPHAQTGRSRRAEVAMVGMVRLRMGQGQATEAKRLIGAYWSRFPKGRRAHEVRRLKAALERR